MTGTALGCLRVLLVCICAIQNGIDGQMATIKKLSLTSQASIRYARVNIQSIVESYKLTNSEIRYSIRIPKSAFITGFWMFYNGKNISAVIMEKDKAAGVYEEAVEDDITAGTVTRQSAVTDDTDVDVFSVAVTVGRKSTVEFNLQYEERLQRKGGKYKQSLYIDSDQVIPDMQINCEFKEEQQFKGLRYITPFGSEIEVDEELTSEDGFYTRKLTWIPNANEVSEFGIGSQNDPFEIEYDLDSPPDGGLVVYNDLGEFVHLFSSPCEDSLILMKQIIFVIDTSGSMKGSPIIQVRQAMMSILSMLRENDYFNIFLFSSSTIKWRPIFQRATKQNIDEATNFVLDRTHIQGATNINDALLDALGQFRTDSSSTNEDSPRYGNFIIFLTDGSPTTGERSTHQILKNVKNYNYIGAKCCKTTISTIAFGKSAAIRFLQALAFENEGTFNVIKDNKDELADNELVESFLEVNNPYYTNLIFSYRVGSDVLPEQNVTRSRFLQYDCGNELIIGGWTNPESNISPTVRVNGMSDEFVFDTVRTRMAKDGEESALLSRLVAYQKVQMLLKESESASNNDEKLQFEAEALNISLHFGFVTPITSLVVTEYTKRKYKSEGGGSKSGTSVKGRGGGGTGLSAPDFYDNFGETNSNFGINIPQNIGSKPFDYLNSFRFIVFINGAIVCFRHLLISDYL